MTVTRFDVLSKLIAERRMSRRDALAKTGAGVAVGAMATIGASGFMSARPASARQATPAPVASPTADNARNVPMLFVQSFQSGSVEAIEGAEHQFTINLERGLGQTIYFSDRPERIVGAMPTTDFLDDLGFTAVNPPNAAIVVEREAGHTDFVVVELLNPVYDAANANLTYDITVLEDWDRVVNMQFTNDPVEAPPATFGTAHLLIDGILDCPDASMECLDGSGSVVGTIDDHDGYCYSWSDLACFPCQPWGAEPSYFTDLCNQRFADCDGACTLWNYCSSDSTFGDTFCRNSSSSNSED